MFCTAVITSASHKRGRAPRRQQSAALCPTICTLKKRHFIRVGERDSLFPATPGEASLPRFPAIPPPSSRVTLGCCTSRTLLRPPTFTQGLGGEEAGEATRTPSGDRCLFGIKLLLVPLPSLANKHMGSQWHMKERAPIQASGTFLSQQSWISPRRGTGPK